MTEIEECQREVDCDHISNLFLTWFFLFLFGFVFMRCCFLFFFGFTKDDDVGTVYQDKDTMAAVLVNHDAEDDALILVTLLLVFL